VKRSVWSQEPETNQRHAQLAVGAEVAVVDRHDARVLERGECTRLGRETCTQMRGVGRCGLPGDVARQVAIGTAGHDAAATAPELVVGLGQVWGARCDAVA